MGKYKKYFTQVQIAKIFGLTENSFNNSSAKERYIKATEQIILQIEQQLIKQLLK